MYNVQDIHVRSSLTTGSPAHLHFLILVTHDLSPRVTDHPLFLLPSCYHGNHGFLLQQGVRDGKHWIGLQLEGKERYGITGTCTCRLPVASFPGSSHHHQYFIASSMKYGGRRPGRSGHVRCHQVAHGRHTEGSAQ